MLEVVGGTTSRPGTWPTLDFELTTVSGRDNSLGAPIRLLPLDDDGAKTVGGDEDVVLRIQGVAGAELTVFAGSTTFPDGSKTGQLSLTQVHGDKVPMQAPLGSNFMLAWSVQPAGVRFDPPARISIPNLGSPAGSVVDIFSFDHDLGEFVSVGTATVTGDGRRVISNPGSGVFKSGWHGCVPPPPPLGDACSPGGCFSCQIKSLGGLLTKTLVPKCGECEDCQGSFCMPKTIDDIVIRVNSRRDNNRVAKGQPASYSAQAIGTCEEYAFKWKFPDGVIETGSFVSHTFDEIDGSTTISVVATCSKPACGLAMKSKTKEIRIFDFELTDPPDHHEWVIDDTPQMPEMRAIAQFVGVSPDPSSETPYTWNFNVRSKFERCPGTSKRTLDFESGDVEQLGPTYKPTTGDRLLGGHVELIVRAAVDNVEDVDQVDNVKIVGTNPSKADISALLGDDDLRRISCRESQQRQFNASANGGTSECPLFNMGKNGKPGDGGVGIMQISYKIKEADHWNWRTNIETAKGYYETAKRRARNHAGNVRGSSGFQDAVNLVNVVRAAVSLPPLTVNVPDHTAEQLRRGGIRCNNGCPVGAGQFGLDLHEYRLFMLGFQLFLVNVNEATLTADAEWEAGTDIGTQIRRPRLREPCRQPRRPLAHEFHEQSLHVFFSRPRRPWRGRAQGGPVGVRYRRSRLPVAVSGRAAFTRFFPAPGPGSERRFGAVQDRLHLRRLRGIRFSLPRRRGAARSLAPSRNRGPQAPAAGDADRRSGHLASVRSCLRCEASSAAGDRSHRDYGFRRARPSTDRGSTHPALASSPG